MDTKHLVVWAVGALILAIGLALLVLEYGRTTTEAKVNAVGFSASGPPALIAVVIGVLVILFPLSPWWPQDLGATLVSSGAATSVAGTATPTVSRCDVVTPGLNIRSGPDESSSRNILTAVTEGAVFTPTARTRDGTWIKIRTTGSRSVEGWVKLRSTTTGQDYVRCDGPVTSLPSD